MTVALPTVDEVEAKIAELDELVASHEGQAREARAERERWRSLRLALHRFADPGKPTGRGNARWGTLRSLIEGALADGRPHKVSELHALCGSSSVSAHLRNLESEGRIVRLGRGSVQLKPPPEASTPVRLESRPAERAVFEHRRVSTTVMAPPTELASDQMRADRGEVRPLAGAAPKAPCPLCSVYRPAVGTQKGRYVYECNCSNNGSKRTRQYFAVDHADRPRGGA